MNYSQIFQLIEKYDFNFFPVWKKEKTPMLTKWTKYQTEKVPKEDFIQKYFSNGKTNNIAILGGAISNNLYMVDIDQNNFANELEKIIPKTLTVQTRNGKHFYYFSSNTLTSTKYKAYQNGNEIFSMDIQGDKKYCVAPPSIHETGIQYTFSTFTDIKKVEFSEIIKKIHILGKKHNYQIRNSKKKRKTKRIINNPTFNRSEWTELESALPSLSSMIGFDGLGLQPIHGSKRGLKGQNISVDSLNNQWFCFHCDIGGHKLQWYAIDFYHFNDCNDIETLTSDQWKEIATNIRKNYNLPDFVPTPQKANKSELTDRQIKLRNKNKEKFTELNLIREIKP